MCQIEQHHTLDSLAIRRLRVAQRKELGAVFVGFILHVDPHAVELGA